MVRLGKNRDLLFGLAACCTAVGSVMTVFILAWQMAPHAVAPQNHPPLADSAKLLLGLGGGLVALGLFLGVWALLGTQREGTHTEPERSRDLFGSALVALGYVFALDGVLNLIAFAGFAATGILDQMFPVTAPAEGAKPVPDMVIGIRLVVSLGVSLLGALFFVTNSLRRKRERGEVYDPWKFWSGLWFRLGEAVIFTTVFFLVFRQRRIAGGDQFLPLIALLLGMFVTTGETLVFGLAQRVLRAATALVASENGGGGRGRER